MKRAIVLSRRGYPAPNPHVGCVLVRAGEVVGEGFHAYAGGPHAEAAALAQAGEHARGATAYVTLEPCAHFGRTPPCSRALLAAGVERVVVACPDPNPEAAGGAREIAEAGVKVEVGLLEREAAQANRQFLFAFAAGRPFVVAKAACSLDGRIALPTGESKWITSPGARLQGRKLRAECGAVLVGRRTVELDDPLLTARMRGALNQPVRVVLDPHARLKGSERVFGPEARTIRVTGAIDLPSLLRTLFAEGIRGLLVEGGAATIGGFLAAGLVDRLELFLAPKLLGAGPAWCSDLGVGSLADALSWNIVSTRRVGPDIWISAEPVTVAH